MVFIDRDKPKSCGSCWYDKNCKRWMTYNWGSHPPSDCPLKELPPHGRLIDADALKKEIRNNITAYYENGFGGYYLAEDAIAEVDVAPTVIPASGKEQRWRSISKT